MSECRDAGGSSNSMARWECDECATGYSSGTAARGCCGTGEACLMDTDN